MNPVVIFTVIMSFQFVSCDTAPKHEETKLLPADSQSGSFKSYAYDAPDKVMTLERGLEEISSLAYDPKNHQLLTNDDESGNYYVLNIQDGSVIEKVVFGKSGDYEGIEMVGTDVIITKSNGTLYVYDQITKQTSKYKNKLKSSNDIEGLCYDSKRNIFLLACKGQPLDQVKGKKDKKCIYAYDNAAKNLDTIPFISIHDEDLITFVNKHSSTLSKSSIRKRVGRVKNFSPSGIAIHPSNEDLYIISAKGSTLVRIGFDSVIKEVGFFDEGKLPQPEGITFDSQEALYIAGEGRLGAGKIFRFDSI